MWKGPRETSVWHRCHDLKVSHCSWQGLEAACCFCNCSLLLQAKQTDFWCCRGLCLWLSTFSMQLSRKLCIHSHRIKTCLLSLTVNYLISTEGHWDLEARFTFQTVMAISLKEIEPFPTPTLYQKPSGRILAHIYPLLLYSQGLMEWSHPKCPPTVEWIHKMWCGYDRILSNTEKGEIVNLTGEGTEIGNIILSEETQT